MADKPEVEVGALIPQPHGGALRNGGPGRVPGRAELARREAGQDLLGYVQKLRAIRDDPEVSAEDLCRAALACLRISGIESVKRVPRKRSTFNVRTTGAQAAQLPDDATNASDAPATNAPARDPEPESGAGAPR